MKKYTPLLMLFTILSIKGFSQVSFSHSIGGSVYLNSNVTGAGIMYSPRLNVVSLGDEASVSVGTHLGVGFSGSVNSQTGGSGAFTLDLPLMVEFNGGFASTPDGSDKSFGYFAGAGFGYNTMGGSSEFGGYGGSSAGPVLNAGVIALIFERPLGFRIAYLINVKDNGANTLGIGVFWSFGDF
jgi:hypothetical protein